MPATRTWLVRVSEFPFGISDRVLGIVQADSRQAAEAKAKDHYGDRTVVEMSHESPYQPERTRLPPRGLQPPVSRRPMTADEAQMARAVACGPRIHDRALKATIRALHARSLGPDRTITEPEAATLRLAVLEYAPQLPKHIVAMAEDHNKAGAA
jgi:hypothetical protein